MVHVAGVELVWRLGLRVMVLESVGCMGVVVMARILFENQRRSML